MYVPCIWYSLLYRPKNAQYIQGISGRMANILGGCSMDYSEQISSYKHVSNFQWVWRYSCLNVMHKKSYKRYEGKTNDVLIAFIGYVNDLNKLQQFKQVFKNPTINFNALLNLLGNSTCSSPEVFLLFLLYEGSTVHNASDQFVCCVYFFFVDFAFHPSPQKKIWSARASFKQLYFHTGLKLDSVYMKLFTRNSPYYNLLKYLLFLLTHPV